MPKLLSIVGAGLLSFLTVAPAYAQDSDSECPYPEQWVIEDLAAKLAAHQEWFARGGLSRSTVSGRANLCNADLRKENLQGAELAGANLQGADLTQADLQWADLSDANLEGADLRESNLSDATLNGASLEGAVLFDANLERGILGQTILVNAKLSGVRLSEAYYQPATAPAQGWLSGIHGLQSIRFCPGETSGLVQLRTALKAAGLRDLEREATYALEHRRTVHALERWKGAEVPNCEKLPRNRWAAIEGVFRLVLFEWPTDYGLAYGRPILILLGLIGVFTLIYLPALLIPTKILDCSGIFLIWPEGRIKQEGAGLIAAKDVVVERLNPCVLSALGLAFYFSVMSAFHLGWRDLNVGTWIARLQPREYALRAKGWVRFASGTQSLISVYLIAMWVLTYFGRPFE